MLSSVIPLHPIRTGQDYEQAVTERNQLLDAGVTNEKHPLTDLANTIGTLIAEYHEVHYPAQEISGLAVLRFLMEQHQLTQSGLPELGTQRVVSEILSGKREMNVL
ncbi:MAG: helix-turn-helix domain-containing protein [Burkholderiaceae bacterium]